MAELFTSITFEVKISGTWVNLTPDVLISPSPRITAMGITGNGIMDRVGAIGTLSFSLDNSSANSAGVEKYYTPGYSSSLTGWTSGLPVRVTFVYDGYSRVKYYGTIDSDGIGIETGKKRTRRVNIKCSNFIYRLSKHTLNLLDYQINLRADQAIQNVIDNMTFKPQSMTLGVGGQTFPTMFDMQRSKTSALGEVNKIVMSGLDYCFIRADETTGEELVYMPRADWLTKAGAQSFTNGFVYPAKNSDYTDQLLNESGGTDYLLNESGGTDYILLEHALSADFSTNTALQDNMVEAQVRNTVIANYIKSVTYPRSVDASAVVLFAVETPITIGPGETLTDIRGQYNDPNNPNIKIAGYEMVAPAATTDYQMWTNTDGLTGVDQTANLTVTAKYGVAEVNYTLTNAGAGTYYIGRLQARGKGIYVYDTNESLYKSDSSIATYGVMPLDIDFPYLDGISSLDNYIVSPGATFYGLDIPLTYTDQVTFFVNTNSAQMLLFMFAEPSDTMYIYETMSSPVAPGAAAGLYQQIITGYDIEIIAGKYVKWSPYLKLATLT